MKEFKLTEAEFDMLCEWAEAGAAKSTAPWASEVLQEIRQIYWDYTGYPLNEEAGPARGQVTPLNKGEAL